MYIGFLAVALNVVGLVRLGYKAKDGWLLGISAELLWIYRAYTVGMYDLMIISLIYCVLAARNYGQWK